MKEDLIDVLGWIVYPFVLLFGLGCLAAEFVKAICGREFWSEEGT